MQTSFPDPYPNAFPSALHLSDGLVSVWQLSADGSDSVGSNTLTNNNLITFVDKEAGAPENLPDTVSSLSTASSQYWSIADNPTLNLASGGFTFAVWAKASALYFGKDDAAAQRSWSFTSAPGFAGLYVFQTDAVYSYAPATGSMDGSQWGLFIVGFNGSKAFCKSYGRSTSFGGELTGMQDQTAALYIGRFWNSYTQGLLSSAMLWSRPLDFVECDRLWNDGNGAFYPTF